MHRGSPPFFVLVPFTAEVDSPLTQGLGFFLSSFTHVPSENGAFPRKQNQIPFY